jgi:hypothetical protein
MAQSCRYNPPREVAPEKNDRANLILDTIFVSTGITDSFLPTLLVRLSYGFVTYVTPEMACYLHFIIIPSGYARRA